MGASVRAAAARLVGGVGFLAGAFDVGAFDTRAFDPGAFLAGVLRDDGAGRSGPPDGAEPVSAASSGRNWRVSPPSAALDSEPAFGSLGAAPGCAVPSLSTAPGCAVPLLSAAPGCAAWPSLSLWTAPGSLPTLTAPAPSAAAASDGAAGAIRLGETRFGVGAARAGCGSFFPDSRHPSSVASLLRAVRSPVARSNSHSAVWRRPRSGKVKVTCHPPSGRW